MAMATATPDAGSSIDFISHDQRRDVSCQAREFLLDWLARLFASCELLQLSAPKQLAAIPLTHTYAANALCTFYEATKKIKIKNKRKNKSKVQVAGGSMGNSNSNISSHLQLCDYRTTKLFIII